MKEFFENLPYQRKHLRAPVGREVLVQQAGDVKKVYLLNVSEGGCLLKSLQGNDESDVGLLFALPLFPRFQSLSVLQQENLQPEIIRFKVLQAKARILRVTNRNIPGQSSGAIALRFIEPNSNLKVVISSYVALMRDNLHYLQTLAETAQTNLAAKAKALKFAKLLGHAPDISVGQLKEILSGHFQGLCRF